MIVWGSKGEVADLGPQESRHCPACEKERSFRLMLQYKVSHIWYVFKWVPEKQYALVCEVCHRGERLVAQAVEARLAKSPIPFMSRWGWAFLVGLMACAFVFGSVESSLRDGRKKGLLASPQKSDIYVVNVSSLLKSPEASAMYGLLRVRGVNGDRVEFDAPAVTYNKASGATKDLRSGKLADPAYFITGPLVLSRDDIAGLEQSGAIHSVERD
jgi:hypothetical protein